ncbi:hypothetical protein B7954_10990, partial [Vibrio cholerae]
KLRKTPRLRNAPTCKYLLKRGPKKGEVCGSYCKIGEVACSKHKTAKKVSDEKLPVDSFDWETVALKTNFKRLKVSRKYKLLKHIEPNVIL